MTARERAKKLVDSWWETDKGLNGLEDDIAAALADERRRVWEEATEIAMILKASRRPSLDWGAGYIEACKDMLAAIAKAHAGQEG